MSQNLSTVSLFQVDAFTSKLFGGNPAAVCLLPESLDPALMQQIAAEMNLSETAFVEPADTAKSTSKNNFAEDAHFNLRWFTPKIEAPLCGHATLAAAATLYEEGNQQDVLYFETMSGRLSVRRQQGTEPMSLQMDLPAYPATSSLPAWLEKASKEFETVFTGVKIQETVWPADLEYVLVTLAPGTTQKQLTDMHCDSRRLESLIDKQHNVVGVIVTCSGDGKPYHFLSRFFAPWAGIEEDPVTGSAHAALGPYWAGKLERPPSRLQARQCSPRGGELQVTVDSSKGRVTVSGQAVIVSKGVLYLPSKASS